MQKRGNLLSISERRFRNDDLGAIARFPGRWRGLAAGR